MFLINSRYPLFNYATNKHSFSLSYRIILPSSFSIINPYALVYLTNLYVFILVRYCIILFPVFAIFKQLKNKKT